MAEDKVSLAEVVVLRRPEEIKEKLPLEYVAETLLGVRVSGSGMLECPFHDDSTPSFNLWAPDERGFLSRFGCFGCGRNGDALDLIELVRGVGFSEALRIAEEELLPAFRRSGWKRSSASVPTRRPEKSPEELAAVVGRLRPLSTYGMTVLGHFGRAKAEESGRTTFASPDFLDYAVEEWEWGGASPEEAAQIGPVVFFPHRAPSGAVTGLKYRDPRLSGGRWTEPGSRFPYLYGSWRSVGAPAVLLCEGETDTVLAAYALRERTDIEVFGLPSGASGAAGTEALSLLADRRTIYLAFDADAAGEAASRRWYEALRKLSSIFIVRLSEGDDVVSSKTPVPVLLERATVPHPFEGIVGLEDGVFVRFGEKKGERVVTRIANFGVEIDRELTTDDGPAYEGRFLDDGREFLLRGHPDLLSGPRFVSWATKYGRTYFGPPSLVPYVASWVSAAASFKPVEIATTRAGKIGRSFVWPGGHLGGDQLRYVPPVIGDPELADRLRLRPGPFDPGAVRALETLNDPAVMAAILGWLTASLLRGRRAPAPPLFVTGESGAGKTKTLETVLESFGFGLTAQLSSTTPYAVDCLVNSTVGFPVWFDEYRRSARRDAMERLQQLLRDAFNGQPSMKGMIGANGAGLSKVETWSALVVSGEMDTGETSHRDRLLLLELDSRAKNREAYSWLTADKSRTEGLGHTLLSFLIERPESHFRLRRYLPGGVPERFGEVLAFVRAGWDAWREFRTKLGVSEPLVEPDYAGFVTARRGSEDPYLEAIRACDNVPARDGNPIVTRTPEGVVKLRLYEVVKEADRLDIPLPGRAHELRKWLERHYSGTRELPRPSGGVHYHVVPGLDLDALR